MKKIIATLVLALAAIGCHAQVPPATTHVVNLTWNAPTASGTWSGCSASAPCTYAVYRCSASATICEDTTNAAYIQITTAATQPSATAYTDTTAAGLTAYYVVETVQSGGNSGPSNVAGPFTVPGQIVAPTLGGSTATASAVIPSAPPRASPQTARLEELPEAPQLVGRTGR